MWAALAGRTWTGLGLKVSELLCRGRERAGWMEPAAMGRVDGEKSSRKGDDDDESRKKPRVEMGDDEIGFTFG